MAYDEPPSWTAVLLRVALSPTVAMLVTWVGDALSWVEVMVVGSKERTSDEVGGLSSPHLSRPGVA